MDDGAELLRDATSSSEQDFMNLTAGQRNALQATERAGASLSLVGVVLIFVTYAAFKRLRTVPNTFILFASIANVGASIACLIGFSGINAGDASALCQVQAFLLEMFMQSDPWWSLAMAVNVYMVFFLAANPNSFRQYLWLYSLVCFGAPALPALVCLFLRRDSRGIYGNATLWCWIDDNWSSLRIFTYYMPIWVCILLSGVIYFAVGYHVFHQRNQLRNLTLSNPGKEESSCDIRHSAENGCAGHPSCYGRVVTEVQITTERSDEIQPSAPIPLSPTIARPAIPPIQPIYPLHVWPCPSDDPNPTCASSSSTAPFATVSSITSSGCTASASRTTTTNNNKNSNNSNNIRPWASSSSSSSSPRLRRTASRFASRIRNLDPVKLAYLRTSFVFAISVLVTWTPSSINRVYTLVYPRRFSFGLNMASAVVLPLQGVWNAVIYCATSWSALRDEVVELWVGFAPAWARGGRARGVERLSGDRWGGRRMERGDRGGQEVELKGRAATVRVFRGGSF